MSNYDPRSISQMYEQYGRTHGGSSSSGSTYDEVPQTLTKGLGTPLNQSFNTGSDDDDDKPNETKSFFENVFSWFNASGAEPKKPERYDGSSLYSRDEFKPIKYDPSTSTYSATGYDPGTPMRSGDDIMSDVDAMLDRSDDAGYTPDPALGSTYDEVKDQKRPPVTIEDAINTAIENTIPTEGYKVQRGDTLSEIAQATGRTVKELQELNNITDPRKMQAGSTLRIPVQTAQDKEIVAGATKMSDLKPLRTSNQSMMTGDQREYEPETGFEGMGPDPSTGKEVKGLMSPPEQFGTEPEGMDQIRFVSTPAIDSIYEEIGEVETTTAHLGAADFENVGITLGYGIVPTSGLKYEHNGTVIELPEDTSQRWSTLSDAGVTRENFNPNKVITDDVVKDGIKRSTYDSDESFTKAVMKQFQDRVERAAERNGVDADDIPEGAMIGLVGYSYNTGVSHNYNLMRPVYEELTQGDNADMNTVQNGMLQVFTENGIVKQGIANRRRSDYNKVAEALGKPTITHKTNRRLPNGNAGFEFEFSDGTTRTFDTGKSYANQTSQDDFKDDLNVRQAVN